MKKTLLLLGMLVAVNMMMAQSQEEAKEKANVKIEEYQERLNLTDEQTEQIKDVREKYKPQFEAVRNDDSKSRSDKMRASADLMDARDAELEAILDEEQMEELKVIREEASENQISRQERRRSMRRN